MPQTLVIPDRTPDSFGLDNHFILKCRRLSYGLLLAVAVVASLTLLAWLAPAFAGLLPGGWKFMKANTAACLLLAVAAMLLHAPRAASRRPGWLWRVLAAAVLLAALLT